MDFLNAPLIVFATGIIGWFLNDKFSSITKQIDGLEAKIDSERRLIEEYKAHFNVKIDKFGDYLADSQTLIVELQHKMNQEILQIHKEIMEVSNIDISSNEKIREINHSINNLKQATAMVYGSVKEMRAAQENHIKDNVVHLVKK